MMISQALPLILLLVALTVWVIVYNRARRRKDQVRKLKREFIQCVEGLLARPLELEAKSDLIGLKQAATTNDWWIAAKYMSALSEPYWREGGNGIQEEWLELSELFFDIKEYIK